MKKIYALGFAALVCATLDGQNAIPNGNFETWQSAGYDVPTGYSNSNPSTFFRCNSPFNLVKWPDPYHGSYSVKLTTNAGSNDTCMAYLINSPNPGDNNPCLWNGGMAYNQMPTGIRGYYKNNTMAGDSGGILVGFRNGTTCLGMYMMKFAGVHNSYTPFQLNFNPPIAGTPDTMIFAAISSDVFNNHQVAGSMLQLDSISFIGAPSPANFNGDFESWQVAQVEKPLYWYANDDAGRGMNKTTDMKAGSYAVELKTYLGSDKNGNLLARSGGISTGYYQNNCQGINCQKGGYPFTNQVDTLCFYYKYSPVNGDTANIGVNFKKNGNSVGGVGAFIHTPSASYAYMEVPFNSFNAIDTAIITIQSSAWHDTTVAFVGSDLKIDEIHFKSQPLSGIRMFDASIGIKAFPNPSMNGNFVLSNVEAHDLIRVYNEYGQEVNAWIRKQDNAALIQVNFPGVYTVMVNSRGKVSTLKIIVGKE